MSDLEKTVKKPAKKVQPELTVDGIVLYTDGGARPTNPGYAGYGFHGYTYSNQEPKKGAGSGTWNVTDFGYKEKHPVGTPGLNEDPRPSVTPLQYIDSFGTVPGIVSNNVAEVSAVTWALEYVKKNPVPNVRIFTDSKGTVEAANGWIDTWAARGWIKSDGRPVANQEYLKALSSVMNQVRDTGTTVEFHWLKGHAGHLGNEASDQLATMGVFKSMSGAGKESDFHQAEATPADGYWSRKVDKHPLMVQRALYFLTDPKTNTPGEYYLGDHGKEMGNVGVRGADGRYSYVVLTEPDAVVENLRSTMTCLADGVVSMCYLVLSKIYEREVHLNLVKHGTGCIFRPKHNRLDHCYLDKEPISREFNPPVLAWRAIDELNTLKGIYLAYKAGSKTLFLTDLTNKFYQDGKKSGKLLREEFGSGVVNFKHPIIFNETGESVEVEFQLGHDLPSRNTLKRLENLSPKIQVAVWMDGEHRVRYVSIVECSTGIGVFGGVYTNSAWLQKPSLKNKAQLTALQ